MDPKQGDKADAGMLENLPEFGKLRGKKVRLADAAARLSRADLEQIVVVMPELGEVRPWRFIGSGEDIHHDENGVLTLA